MNVRSLIICQCVILALDAGILGFEISGGNPTEITMGSFTVAFVALCMVFTWLRWGFRK